MPKTKMPPLLVGPREAAQLLGESLDKTYDRINDGTLPSYIDGRLRRIEVADIHALIARMKAEQPVPQIRPSPRQQQSKHSA